MKDPVEPIKNKFDMILVATMRAREIAHGDNTYVDSKNKPVITALKEIEQGFVGREYLKRLRRR